MHVHDLGTFFKSTEFDFSHIIHSISFGKSKERIFNPLDNTQKETTKSKYFIFDDYINDITLNIIIFINIISYLIEYYYYSYCYMYNKF